jgi:broad specificity polyphosphatase/5'/3'-nucleotidase SurE
LVASDPDLGAIRNRIQGYREALHERAGPLTVTRQGQGLMKTVEVVPRIDPRGIDYSWLHITREQHADAIGSETEVIAAGGIAVTPLQFERTAEQIWLRLTEKLTNLVAEEIESRSNP